MSSGLPVVLILGHSFVKRLFLDIKNQSHHSFSLDFNLKDRASVRVHGVGGRTVPKLWKHDLLYVSRLHPDIVILEIGTNDLSVEDPNVVAASIEVLVRYLHDSFGVKIVGFCLVIPRRSSTDFNAKVTVFNQLVHSLLEPIPYVFSWFHKRVSSKFLLRDGVHLNHSGQLRLYRSYRGALLKSLSML